MHVLQAKAFFFLFIVISLLVLMAPAYFIYRIDPFAIYRSHDPSSISQIDQFRHMRTTKRMHVLRQQPEAVVIGSSIAGRLKTNQGRWKNLNTYNLSLPGITPHEMLRLVQHSHAVRPLQELVIVPDFLTFSTSLPEARFGFPESLMLQSPADKGTLQYYLNRLADLRTTLLTMNSSLVALEALVKRSRGLPVSPSGAIYYDDGSWERPILDTRSERFANRHRSFQRKFSSVDAASQLETDRIAPLLAFCYTQGIRTHIVISPLHFALLENLRHQEALSTWKTWQRELVSLNEQLAEQHQRRPFPVMGFNLAAGMVDENIVWPDNSVQPWFEDGMHFSSRFGRRILRTALQQDEQAANLLNSATISVYLDSVDRRSLHYANRNGTPTRDHPRGRL